MTASPAGVADRAPGMPSAATVVRAGIAAGVAGGIALIAWQLLCGEIANAPTPVAGIDSSTWTIDDPNLVHESTPPWSPWIGHAAYGAALGLVLSRRLHPRP